MAVGETRNVQVRLENSLPLRAGDHVVVLSYSPVMLIGGWRVLLSRCRRSRELAEGERALYASLEAGDIEGAVDAWLALQALPVAAADVTAALDLVAGEAEAALRGLVAQGAACALAGSGGSLYADSSALDAAMDALATTLSAMHAASPKETGFTPGAVAHAAWPAADEGVAAALIAEGCSRGVCAAEGAEVFDPHSAAAAAECGSNTSAPSAAHTPREQPSAIRAAATPSSAAGHAAWATAPGVKPVSLGDAACMADRVVASASIAASSAEESAYSEPPEPASAQAAPCATSPRSAASASPATRSSAAVTSAAATGSACSASHASTAPSISPASSDAYSARSPSASSRERRQRESSTRQPPISITGE